MNKPDVIKAYFKGLESRSYEQIIQLFDKDAVVHSPLYGQIKADQFYKELFAVTSSSKINLENIFLSESNPNIAAAHFEYDWTLKDGAKAPFECIDVFKFSAENKIIELKIIYDTYQVREKFETVTKNSN
jgi:hypothetical protein